MIYQQSFRLSLLSFNKSESLECAKVVVLKLGAILFYSGIHFKPLKLRKKKIYIYIYIYNLHGLSCQEKVSRFSMLLIPRYGTSLAVSHWKLRMVLMVEYRSSRLDQNKPFSGPVSTLLSSSPDFTVSACLVAYAPLDLLH